MTRYLAYVSVAGVLGLGLSQTGCGDDDKEANPDAAVDAAGDAAGDAAATQAFLRVAHLSPDAPAVDFCIAPHGTTTFAGPLLKGLANNAGLSYSEVTQYIPVAPEQYDVRLVAPAAADCNTNLTGTQDTTNLPKLEKGNYVTLAAIGLTATGSAQPLTLKAYPDVNTVVSDKAKVRFIHASPGTGNVDVGLVTDSTFSALFSNVAYGETGSGNNVDNGYLLSNPLSAQTLSVRIAGTSTEALKVESLSVPAGRVETIFAIGTLTEAQRPLKALICEDNATASGGKTVCSIKP